MKAYGYSLLLSFIYMFPVIVSKIYYQDDVRRSLTNNASTWLSEGRPLMAGIHYLLNFGTEIFNLAPLTQIIGVTILCYAGYLFIQKYVLDMPMYLKTICIVSLITSPFYWENLAYGFESIGFCISLAIPIFMCCLWEKETLFKTFATFFVGTFAVLCIYQASFGAVLIVAMVALYLRPTEWKLCFTRILGAIVSVLTYILTIARSIRWETYQGMDSSSYVFSPAVVFDNLMMFLNRYVDLFFANSAVSILFGLVLLACLASIYFHVKEVGIEYAWISILPIIAFFITVLPLSFLSHRLLLPRLFISFNIVCFFVMILLSQLCMRFSLTKCILALTMLWMFSFSYLFGGLLVAQNRYENFVANCIFYDLGKLNVEKTAEYYYSGNSLICREVKKATKKYKIFGDIANVSFRPDRVFWTNKVSQYINYVIKKQPKSLEKQEYPILVSHNLYYIAGDSKHVIIWIK